MGLSIKASPNSGILASNNSKNSEEYKHQRTSINLRRSFIQFPCIVWAGGFLAERAVAAPTLQMRQAAEVIAEKLAASLTPQRVLDKVTTVITGQTMVEPETVEKELKAILGGEEDVFAEIRSEILTNASAMWSSAVNWVMTETPSTILESAIFTVQGLLEGFAEKFAAWELSSLVALGERWLIWTPIVVLPMYWQMTKQQREENNLKLSIYSLEPDEKIKVKREQIRSTLERIRLTDSALCLISTLGEDALRPSQEARLKKQSIEGVITKLKQLNNALPVGPKYDGVWKLVYVSEKFDQKLIGFYSGVDIVKLEERLSSKSTSSEVPNILVHINAIFRIGPFGDLNVSAQGEYEVIGSNLIMSFDNLSIKPAQLLNLSVSDVLNLDIQIPTSFRQPLAWELFYLDEHIRIQKAAGDIYFLFTRNE